MPFLTSYRHSTPAVQYSSCTHFLSLFTPPFLAQTFLYYNCFSLSLATPPHLNLTIHNLPLLTFYATLFCRYSPPSNLHPAVKYPCLSHFCTLLHLPLLAQVFRRALPPATLPLFARHPASPANPYRPPPQLITLDVPYSRCDIHLPFLYLSLISSQISHKHYFLAISQFPFLAR